MTKKCIRCKKEKEETEFKIWKGNLTKMCLVCLEKNREEGKRSYEKNKERKKEYAKKNKEKIQKRMKEWYEENKKEVLERRKCKHGSQKLNCKICNPLGHLRLRVSIRVAGALKREKSKASIEYLGCDIPSYKKYLEEKFKPGMTWDNHGEWHIDHIIPVMYKEGEEEITLEMVEKRLHYTNTQPLWASENISKGNRYIGDYIEDF